MVGGITILNIEASINLMYCRPSTSEMLLYLNLLRFFLRNVIGATVKNHSLFTQHGDNMLLKCISRISGYYCQIDRAIGCISIIWDLENMIFL